MKIVIFEPHPDDLLFGPGPVIFDWLKEGHTLHVITVTDGRACYRGHKNIKIPEDEVAEMRIEEAKKAVEYLGLSLENHLLLYFPDAKARRHVKEGIEKVKSIIKDADRIVLPSNNNFHPDHQATHDIAKGASKELELNIEYFVYFIPSYGVFKEDSNDRIISFEITETIRPKLQEWFQIYQSQKLPIQSYKFYTRYLKRVRKMQYSTYTLKDMGSYYNF